MVTSGILVGVFSVYFQFHDTQVKLLDAYCVATNIIILLPYNNFVIVCECDQMTFV